MADDYIQKTAEAGERVKARQRELEQQKKAKAHLDGYMKGIEVGRKRKK